MTARPIKPIEHFAIIFFSFKLNFLRMDALRAEFYDSNYSRQQMNVKPSPYSE